jgi:hypothetical protein
MKKIMSMDDFNKNVFYVKFLHCMNGENYPLLRIWLVK